MLINSLLVRRSTVRRKSQREVKATRLMGAAKVLLAQLSLQALKMRLKTGARVCLPGMHAVQCGLNALRATPAQALQVSGPLYRTVLAKKPV